MAEIEHSEGERAAEQLAAAIGGKANASPSRLPNGTQVIVTCSGPTKGEVGKIAGFDGKLYRVSFDSQWQGFYLPGDLKERWLADTPATNAIRARYRGDDRRLGAAMIAHANDMERRLTAIAAHAAYLREEWLVHQSETFRECIACIIKNAPPTLLSQDNGAAPRSADAAIPGAAPSIVASILETRRLFPEAFKTAFFTASPSQSTLCFTLSEDESKAMNELCLAKDLSAEHILRQALRLYQLHWKEFTAEPPTSAGTS